MNKIQELKIKVIKSLIEDNFGNALGYLYILIEEVKASK